MKFKIDPKIFEKYPGTTIGVVVAKGIDNSGDNDEIQKLIEGEQNRIRANFDPETLSQEPKINCWRKAYAEFGCKPREAKSSVENLYKLVARGIDLRKINKLVDIYNYICLKHMFPVGGEDIDAMVGDLRLTFAADSEQAVKILGDEEAEIPPAGEVLYRDDEGIICRRWNWREADRTKLTENTKNAVLVVESVPPGTEDEISAAIEELSELVEKLCCGETRTFILNENKNEVEL